MLVPSMMTVKIGVIEVVVGMKMTVIVIDFMEMRMTLDVTILESLGECPSYFGLCSYSV